MLAVLLGTSLPNSRVQASDFNAAAAAFEEELTLPERLRLQVRLIAEGLTSVVPTERLNAAAFQAIKTYQRRAGFPITGQFTYPVATRLRDDTQPIMDAWGFQWVEHPSRPLRILAPLGVLSSVAQATRYGSHYEDDAGRLQLDLLSYPNRDVRFSYEDSMQDWRRRNVVVKYHLFSETSPRWWVASTTSPDGHDHYYRYEQDGDAVTGFALEWNNAAGNVHGERVAVIMSGVMYAVTQGFDFPDLSPLSRSLPPLREAAMPVAPPPPASSAAPEPKQATSGTGFFVTAQGHLVTNAHVVKDCGSIEVRGSGGARFPAVRLANDERNDLALLRVEEGARPPRVAALRVGVRLGEPIEAFGFPHAGLLSSQGNFTTGTVTALSGLGDDSGILQVSAPVQSGNSGGPLLDASGNVIGVVTSKLDAVKMLAAADDLPQNVNFAIKASRVAEFLGANGVAFTPGAAGAAMGTADIADAAQAMSTFVMCKP